jgi:hypothetical protein
MARPYLQKQNKTQQMTKKLSGYLHHHHPSYYNTSVSPDTNSDGKEI